MCAYKCQVSLICVGGLIQVPRCSSMKGILSMWSGTCSVLKFHDVKQSTQLHILHWYQSGQVEVSRSSDHVLWFLCRRREGKHERCCVFSRWQVSGGSR